MKRITLSLTMAMSCLMTTQSFGFDLLDRMLGSKGCGCDTQCCDTPVVAGPGCGCEAPSAGCGLLGGCLKGCEAPACGCEAPACGCEAPACGCEVADCGGCDAGCMPKRGGLLKKLFSKAHCNKGCDSACGCGEPACGAEVACGCAEPACGCAEPACGCGEVAACDTGCDSCGLGGCKLKLKRPGLLSKLFGGHRNRGCDECCDAAPSCGCGATEVVPMSTPAHDVVPTAPAPIVDPSASIKTKSRVVQASARYVH